MPPLPNVPSTIKTDLHFSVGTDSNALTRLHWEYSGGPPSSADMTTLCHDISTAWSSNLGPYYTNGGGLLSVVGTDLASSNGASSTFAGNVSGTRTGGDLPNGVCVLLNHHIARRYRGGKPRSYMPLFTLTDVQTGAWLAASVNSLSTAWAAFVAAVIGATSGSTAISSFVNVSYYSGFTVVTSPTTGRARNVPKLRVSPVVDVITSSSVNPKPGSQRRRNLHSV